jgi:hypothetical protein
MESSEAKHSESPEKSIAERKQNLLGNLDSASEQQVDSGSSVDQDEDQQKSLADYRTDTITCSLTSLLADSGDEDS